MGVDWSLSILASPGQRRDRASFNVEPGNQAEKGHAATKPDAQSALESERGAP